MAVFILISSEINTNEIQSGVFFGTFVGGTISFDCMESGGKREVVSSSDASLGNFFI